MKAEVIHMMADSYIEQYRYAEASAILQTLIKDYSEDSRYSTYIENANKKLDKIR